MSDSLSAEDAVEIEELIAEGTVAAAPDDGAFRVRLDNFEGPFDLLLNLISRRQMDVTEVALQRGKDGIEKCTSEKTTGASP